MEFSAEMIAGFLGGEIVGDPKAAVSTLAKIEEARPVHCRSSPIPNTNTTFTTPVRRS